MSSVDSSCLRPACQCRFGWRWSCPRCPSSDSHPAIILRETSRLSLLRSSWIQSQTCQSDVNSQSWGVCFILFIYFEAHLHLSRPSSIALCLEKNIFSLVNNRGPKLEAQYCPLSVYRGTACIPLYIKSSRCLNASATEVAVRPSIPKTTQKKNFERCLYCAWSKRLAPSLKAWPQH